jgi:hypothetical protein
MYIKSSNKDRKEEIKINTSNKTQNTHPTTLV